MPTYVLTTEDPDGGEADWEVNPGGGLSPDLEASLEANWPRTPAELHLLAPGWAPSLPGLLTADTILIMDELGTVLPGGEGYWLYIIGNTGGGDGGYAFGFNMNTTLFGDGPFTPTGARISFISSLTSQDASPVRVVATLRLYTVNEDGDRVVAAMFQTDVMDAPVLPVTGATPASFSIPLSGLALPITGRVFLSLTLVLSTEDAMSNNVEFGFEGLHLTFT